MRIEHKLKGAEIRRVLRRAKYLIFETNKGSLINHLGMTGSWRFGEWSQAKTHDHFSLELSSGEELIFNDPRRFGYIDWTDGNWEESQWFGHLGPEPLDASFCAASLIEALMTRKGPIKNVLMDQKVVVGVGNIYASECLFLAKIHPLRPANTLSMNEVRILVRSIKKVLQQSITSGGTSFRDFKSLYGDRGANTQNLRVYARKGQPCYSCDSPIEGVVLGQRSTFFCPSCQR